MIGPRALVMPFTPLALTARLEADIFERYLEWPVTLKPADPTSGHQSLHLVDSAGKLPVRT